MDAATSDTHFPPVDDGVPHQLQAWLLSRLVSRRSTGVAACAGRRIATGSAPVAYRLRPL